MQRRPSDWALALALALAWTVMLGFTRIAKCHNLVTSDYRIIANPSLRMICFNHSVTVFGNMRAFAYEFHGVLLMATNAKEPHQPFATK
jgi:hypothetical protein